MVTTLKLINKVIKMKKLFAILLTLTLIFSLAACSENNNDVNSSVPTSSTEAEKYTPADISVAYMTGPTGVGMVKLNADSDEKKTENNYTFKVAATADEFKADFLAKKINIASVPTNLAAALYNATGGKVRILAVNTYGVLSIIENGNSITSIKDLKGKTLYATGKGQNPEYILKYILEKNNIDSENDLTIKFVDSKELTAKIISGEAQIAMAPEPAASTVLTKNDKLNRVLSINDEWAKISDSKLMMGCVIALDSYVQENPKAVEKFLSEYEKSVNFATENIDKTAEYCEKYGVAASAAIAKKAIPNCNLCFVTGTQMKDNVNAYINVLFDADAKSIGGKLPADDIYYNAK